MEDDTQAKYAMGIEDFFKIKTRFMHFDQHFLALHLLDTFGPPIRY